MNESLELESQIPATVLKREHFFTKKICDFLEDEEEEEQGAGELDFGKKVGVRKAELEVMEQSQEEVGAGRNLEVEVKSMLDPFRIRGFL